MDSASCLSSELLDLLVCPIDHQALIYVESENILYNERLKKKYEIKNTIPIMLVEKALDVSQEEHERYIAKLTRKTKS